VLDHVYGVGADIEEKVVEVYISRLRHKLKDYGVLIQARRGLGYQILAQEST
jgi:two-component system OmpR family response regulator